MEQEARKQQLATAIESNFETNPATTTCQADAPHDGDTVIHIQKDER